MKANKYKIKPTPEQQARLAVQFGHARFIYRIYLTSIVLKLRNL